jgi:hypothetical protein
LFKYVSPDETAFIRWSFAQQLTSVGFRDVKIKSFDWLHPAIPAGLNRPIQAVGRVFEALPIIREISRSLLVSAKRP